MLGFIKIYRLTFILWNVYVILADCRASLCFTRLSVIPHVCGMAHRNRGYAKLYISACRAVNKQQCRMKWQNLSIYWSFTPGSSVMKWKPLQWWSSSWVAEKTLWNGAERVLGVPIRVSNIFHLFRKTGTCGVPKLWGSAELCVSLCVVNTSPGIFFSFICPPSPSHFPCVMVV